MPGNFYALTPEDIAKWPVPNYTNPTDTRTWLPAYALSWQAVTTVLALGRFYLRARRKAGTWGYDDALVFIGWIFSIGLTVLACMQTWLYGMGRHIWDVPPGEYVNAAKTGYLAQQFFLFSTFGTKLSVLLFYRRMVKDSVTRAWLYVIWFFMAITVMAYFSAFITFLSVCQPLEAYWLAYRFVPPYEVKYQCINGPSLDLAISVVVGLSDVWSVVIPCLMLRYYQLDISRKQKFVLNFVFSLGFLATGAGIARSYYLWQIAHQPDLFWNGFDLFVWGLLEAHLALICACVPSLRAFFRYYFGDPVRRTNTSQATHSNLEHSTFERSTLHDSRRWSIRKTKDSWLTEMSTMRTRDFPPRSPMSPLGKSSTEIALFPKSSNEELG